MRINFYRSIVVIAAVFILLSCGIPSYFYLGSGGADYSIGTSSKTDTGVTVNYSMYDSSQVQKIEEGPGIMFLYTICDMDSASFFGTVGSYSTNYPLISSFNTIYKCNDYRGYSWAPVDKGAITNYTEQGESTGYFQDGYTRIFNLYPFYDGQSQKFSIPYYEDHPANIEFGEEIELKVEDNVVTIVTPGGEQELTRFDGKSFAQISRIATDRTDVDLYGIKGADILITEPLYLHIYTAMTAGTGKFSNIYWTNLYYLGNYKLAMTN